MKFVARLPFAVSILLAAAAAPLAVADNRVLDIGIDGAGGGFLNNANTPAIDALIVQGGIVWDACSPRYCAFPQQHGPQAAVMLIYERPAVAELARVWAGEP